MPSVGRWSRAGAVVVAAAVLCAMCAVRGASAGDVFRLGFMQSLNAESLGSPTWARKAFEMAVAEANATADFGDDTLVTGVFDIQGTSYGPFFRALEASAYCVN